MKKKPEIKKDRRKQLMAQALRVWKIACINKWGNKCGACGKEIVCVHHFFPRSIALHLKFDVENGIPICISCHTGLHWRSDPRIERKIIARRGSKWYNALEKRADEKHFSYMSIKWIESEVEKLKKYL